MAIIYVPRLTGAMVILTVTPQQPPPINVVWVTRDQLATWKTRDQANNWQTRDDLATWKARN